MKRLVEKFRTPKQTKDWYIKWGASVILLTAMVLRSTGEFQLADMCLSFVGCAGWIGIGVLWKDRALLVLNTVACFILATGIVNNLIGAS